MAHNQAGDFNISGKGKLPREGQWGEALQSPAPLSMRSHGEGHCSNTGCPGRGTPP